MTNVINRDVVEDTFGTAELYKDGLLEVSNADSAVICMIIGIPDKDAARLALIEMMGQVGRVLPIAAEGVDF